VPYKDPVRQRQYQTEWCRRRRRAWLAEHGPCVDCGTWDDLEVDHVDPSIKVSHRVWSWARARRDAELAKCVARCFPCHGKKTNAEGRAQRYCLRNHDTWATGRDATRRCLRCRAEYEYPRTNARKRAKGR
jgi:hypothetical protein